MLRYEADNPCNLGWLPPASPYTATHLRPGRQDISWSAFASHNGILDSCLTEVAVGDTLLITSPHSVRSLLIPALNARIDAASASVSGMAPPASRLRISLDSTLETSGYDVSERTLYITATASGAYTGTFSHLAPLTTASGKLTYFDDSGDQVTRLFNTPRWTVRYNWDYLQGTAAQPGVPLSITHNSSSRSISETVQVWPSSDDGQYSVNLQHTILPGDDLTFRDGDQTLLYHLPALTVQHDFEHEVLEGTVLPGSLVSAHLPQTEDWNYTYGLVRQVTADSSGFFGLDVSDLHLPLYFEGYISVSDVQGNTIEVPFRVLGHTAYLPVIGR